jgi:hypothetical protein
MKNRGVVFVGILVLLVLSDVLTYYQTNKNRADHFIAYMSRQNQDTAEPPHGLPPDLRSKGRHVRRTIICEADTGRFSWTEDGECGIFNYRVWGTCDGYKFVSCN